MIWGVKYCGGCNPRYNRTDFLDRLKKKCEDTHFEYVQKGKTYKHLLVICGCPSRCADLSDIHVEGETIKISEASQLEQVIQRIRNHK